MIDGTSRLNDHRSWVAGVRMLKDIHRTSNTFFA